MFINLVIAVNQHITYDEHLPLLLGPTAYAKVQSPDEAIIFGVSEALGFEPVELDDPSVRNEFAVAGYRWGHANLKDEFDLSDRDLNFKRDVKTVTTFFNPETIYTHGPGQCLRGAMTKSTGANSGVFWDTFQHHLFRPKDKKDGTTGSDLLSFNLGRGREHGIGSYMTVRRFCMNHPLFQDLYGPESERSEIPKNTSMQTNWDNVLGLYQTIEDVDLYVGLLYENPSNGALFGPTNQCINTEQFIALKKGDKFFYTKPNVFDGGTVI